MSTFRLWKYVTKEFFRLILSLKKPVFIYHRRYIHLASQKSWKQCLQPSNKKCHLRGPVPFFFHGTRTESMPYPPLHPPPLLFIQTYWPSQIYRHKTEALHREHRFKAYYGYLLFADLCLMWLDFTARLAPINTRPLWTAVWIKGL